MIQHYVIKFVNNLQQVYIPPYLFLFVSQLVAGRLFSPGTPVSSTNKTDPHDIPEILLKVALNTINIALAIQALPYASLHLHPWL